MQMADITIKKADGTTNVVYSTLTASAGDRSPAVWRSNSSATLRGNRITVQMETRWNGPSTARRATVSFSAPMVRTINAVETVVARVPIELSVVIPEGLTDAEVTEVVEQAMNFYSAPLIRQSIAQGYSPV